MTQWPQCNGQAVQESEVACPGKRRPDKIDNVACYDNSTVDNSTVDISTVDNSTVQLDNSTADNSTVKWNRQFDSELKFS